MKKKNKRTSFFWKKILIISFQFWHSKVQCGCDKLELGVGTLQGKHNKLQC
jgi:hypothetical protein